MSTKFSLLGLLLALVAAPSFAQVAVSNAWVRGTVAGQKATGAFMSLTSPVDVTLVSASSPAAKVVEIHEMAMDGGVMKMRLVDKLTLPAGKSVEMKPGSYHVMLLDITAPLAAGEIVPFTLTFVGRDGKKSTQVVQATVKALTAAADPHKH